MTLKNFLILIFSCVLLFSSSLGGFLIGYKIAEKSQNEPSLTKFLPKNVNKTIPAPISSNIIADISEKVIPWVVNIKMEYDDINQSAYPDQMHPFMPFDFDDNKSKIKIRVTGGSGVIIRKDGYILTNSHVLKNAKNIIVTLNNSKSYKAEIIGTDDVTDIAVLKINPNNEDLPVAEIGDSAKLRIGEWIIAVGSPLGYEQTVTQGIISAVNRRVNDIPASVNFIQTDAAINPGNSGGPLINMNGQVIGINTAIRADAQNIGFAIPINIVKKISEEIIKTGNVARPWIGIEIRDKELSLPYGIDIQTYNAKGVLITRVLPGSPAERARMKKDDIILKIDGIKVKDVRDVQEKVRNHKIGKVVKFDILRNNKKIRLNIKTEKLPSIW
ncbi:MAG: hypothetical protein A2287_01130 [Candidatus Melainabacteria bacterium RIFOXYA12_FULL_32_12]|nr:MAG: hypothetical protein A2255_04045 [Candidatus Melainabacteria bacterium RIFOXYA2_FULL_32_9]OGI26799.1 MAG: hypothetical protein A2287_01130 [Candidatus Melainabacteria bacterium RIFOXYA12_FULL_32_12]